MSLIFKYVCVLGYVCVCKWVDQHACGTCLCSGSWDLPLFPSSALRLKEHDTILEFNVDATLNSGFFGKHFIEWAASSVMNLLFHSPNFLEKVNKSFSLNSFLMFNLFFGYNSTFPLLCLGRHKYFHQFNIVVIKICYFTINSPAEFKGFPDTLYKFPGLSFSPRYYSCISYFIIRFYGLFYPLFS